MHARAGSRALTMAAEDSNKVVLVGDFGVGKTTIFTRFKTGKSEGGSLNTRKESECSKSVTVDGEAMPVSGKAGVTRQGNSAAIVCGGLRQEFGGTLSPLFSSVEFRPLGLLGGEGLGKGTCPSQIPQTSDYVGGT